MNNEAIICDSSDEFDAVMKLWSAMATAGILHNAVKHEEGGQAQETLEYVGVQEPNVDERLSKGSVQKHFPSFFEF